MQLLHCVYIATFNNVCKSDVYVKLSLQKSMKKIFEGCTCADFGWTRHTPGTPYNAFNMQVFIHNAVRYISYSLKYMIVV